VQEIAQVLEIAPDEVKEYFKNTGRHVSMDAPITQEDDGTLYDVLLSPDSPLPDKGLLNDSLRKEIERSLSTLTHREANIIRLFYGLNGNTPLSLEEIGEEFCLTRERVRQIKEKALKRLKNTTRCRNLKAYLG